MKITITGEDGTTLEEFIITPLFSEEDVGVAAHIRAHLAASWIIQARDNKLMTPAQYEAYRTEQRLQGRVLRSPYLEGDA